MVDPSSLWILQKILSAGLMIDADPESSDKVGLTVVPDHEKGGINPPTRLEYACKEYTTAC